MGISIDLEQHNEQDVQFTMSTGMCMFSTSFHEVLKYSGDFYIVVTSRNTGLNSTFRCPCSRVDLLYSLIIGEWHLHYLNQK